MSELTKAQEMALEWFSGVVEAHLFGAGDPSLTMVRRLESRGFVQGRRPAHVGFIRYSITEAGRQALAGARGE